jgi:hypothetical protein
VRSGQFSSGQKKGSHFLDLHKTPKNAQKTPQTPKNAPKRPKTPQKRPFFGVCFFRSGQFRSVFSGQVSSGHFRSGQVPDLIGRSGESVNHLSDVRRGPECFRDNLYQKFGFISDGRGFIHFCDF